MKNSNLTLPIQLLKKIFDGMMIWKENAASNIKRAKVYKKMQIIEESIEDSMSFYYTQISKNISKSIPEFINACNSCGYVGQGELLHNEEIFCINCVLSKTTQGQKMKVPFYFNEQFFNQVYNFMLELYLFEDKYLHFRIQTTRESTNSKFQKKEIQNSI